MERKIIQINSMIIDDKVFVVALCDDGSTWGITIDPINKKKDAGWSQLPYPPKD